MTDIKELALKVAKDIGYWDEQEEYILDFATRLIAAYLAEQEPVLVIKDYKSAGKIARCTHTEYGETVSLPSGTKLFTAPPLPAIPDGCVVVPRVPTKEMVAASWNAAGSVRFGDGQEKYIAVAYQAMIAVGEVK